MLRLCSLIFEIFANSFASILLFHHSLLFVVLFLDLFMCWFLSFFYELWKAVILKFGKSSSSFTHTSTLSTVGSSEQRSPFSNSTLFRICNLSRYLYNLFFYQVFNSELFHYFVYYSKTYAGARRCSNYSLPNLF